MASFVRFLMTVLFAAGQKSLYLDRRKFNTYEESVDGN